MSERRLELYGTPRLFVDQIESIRRLALSRRISAAMVLRQALDLGLRQYEAEERIAEIKRRPSTRWL